MRFLDFISIFTNRIFKYFPIGLFLTIFILSSCQKIVNIDLNSASPKIVIEAVIDNGHGPYKVKLSKTGSYFDTPVLPPVTGARVIISDNLGRVDTLTDNSDGTYFTHRIRGAPGLTYHLSVLAENVEYTASSSMMHAVDIDSIGIDVTQRFSFGPRARRDSSIIIHFRDPSYEKNYYRIKFMKLLILSYYKIIIELNL